MDNGRRRRIGGDAVNQGLILLAAWGQFLALLLLLCWFIVRGGRR